MGGGGEKGVEWREVEREKREEDWVEERADRRKSERAEREKKDGRERG